MQFSRQKQEDPKQEDEVSLLGNNGEGPSKAALQKTLHSRTIVLWRFTAINVLLSIAFSFLNFATLKHFGTFIRPTDLHDARSSIEYENRHFTGGLIYDVKQRRTIRAPDGDIEYFGPPSQNLEQAWKDLLRCLLKILSKFHNN